MTRYPDLAIRPGAARIALFVVVAALAIACNGCGDKEGKDTLRGVAKALHRVANATARADEVTHRLFLDGIISAQEAEAISIALADINRASGEFQKKARTYTEYNAQAKADILIYAGDARDYIAARIADGTARIKNQRAREDWSAIVNVAHDAFASIIRLVEAAKPKGSAQ